MYPVLDDVARWNDDPGFTALPYDKKRQKLTNYFDWELADEDFYTLSDEEQEKKRANFIVTHVGRNRTKLPKEKENEFRKWYADRAEQAGIEPNPDNPNHKYDYRAAFVDGGDIKLDPNDGLYHWPSKFKDLDHPNRFVDGRDTLTEEFEPAKKIDASKWELGKAFIEGAKNVARSVLMHEAARATLAPEMSQEDIRDAYAFMPPEAALDFLAPAAVGKPGAKEIEKYATEKFKPDAEFQETASFPEHVMMVGPQIMTQVLSSLASGPTAGAAMMFAQISGSTFEELKNKGVDPNTAAAAGLWNAAMQAPLEQIGISKAMKFWRVQGSILAKSKELVETIGTEWLTEFLQQFPDEAVNIFATNPDKTLLEKTQKFIENVPKAAKEGAYQGLMTAPWAALTGVGGHAANKIAGHKPFDLLSDPKNAETGRAIDNLLKKTAVDVKSGGPSEPGPPTGPEPPTGPLRTPQERQAEINRALPPDIERLSPEDRQAIIEKQFQEGSMPDEGVPPGEEPTDYIHIGQKLPPEGPQGPLGPGGGMAIEPRAPGQGAEYAPPGNIEPETGTTTETGNLTLEAPTVDDQAHEAATSPLNDTPEPTESQIEAGNYKKGHIQWNGLDISIENPRGSTRSGTSPDGKKWETELTHHYGYVRRTEGPDGDQVDVFFGPNEESDKVFIVDQLDPEKKRFDEHKILLGFDSLPEAIEGYDSNYDPNWKGRGPITEVSVDDFKKWLKDGDTTEAVSPLIKRGKVQDATRIHENERQVSRREDQQLGTPAPERTVEQGEVEPTLRQRPGEGGQDLYEQPEAGTKTGDQGELTGEQLAEANGVRYMGEANGLEHFGVETPKGETTIATRGLDEAELKRRIKDTKKAFAVKPETEKEKALREYRDYVLSLSDNEIDAAGDLIEEEPEFPTGHILKIKKKLGEKPTQPQAPPEESAVQVKPERPIVPKSKQKQIAIATERIIAEKGVPAKVAFDEAIKEVEKGEEVTAEPKKPVKTEPKPEKPAKPEPKPTLTESLKGIKIETKVKIAETGNIVRVETDASEAYRDAMDKRTLYEKLLNCIKR